MPGRIPLFGRVVLIGGTALAMFAVSSWAISNLRGTGGTPDAPPVMHTAAPPETIPAEAFPYRGRARELAAPIDVGPRAQAQPRTMAVHRGLRAYPGAPPRIPHGLTDREFRESRCNSCHERGGFVPRFGTYAPVTPHPEFSSCLQCHAPDAMSVGLGIPELTQDVICGQCHVDPDEPPPTLVAIDWQPAEWPELGQRAMPGSPLWIPHGLQLREDCIACHGGPSAVTEIRTTHPERTDCRSCHVPGPSAGPPQPAEPAIDSVFTRSLDPGGER